MKNPAPIATIALLLFAASATAQEATEDSAAVDAISAEVFASDIVAPDVPQEDIQIDEKPTLDQVVPVADEAPTLDQVVPVADEAGEAGAERVRSDVPDAGVQVAGGPTIGES